MLEHLTCAEEALICEFGTETFRVGKTLFEARVPISEIDTDYGGIESPVENVDRMTIVVLKGAYPKLPRTGQEVLHVESRDKYKISRVSGRTKCSPTWRIELGR